MQQKKRTAQEAELLAVDYTYSLLEQYRKEILCDQTNTAGPSSALGIESLINNPKYSKTDEVKEFKNSQFNKCSLQNSIKTIKIWYPSDQKHYHCFKNELEE
jgi:hypothetical protein